MLVWGIFLHVAIKTLTQQSCHILHSQTSFLIRFTQDCLLFQVGPDWCPSEHQELRSGDLQMKLLQNVPKHRHIMAMEILIEKHDLQFPNLPQDEDTTEIYENLSQHGKHDSTYVNSEAISMGESISYYFEIV